MFENIKNTEEYNALIHQGVIAIDVRTPDEYKAQRIPNIITGFDWNAGEFYDKAEELDKSKDYILVCRSGNRSVQACQYMNSSGFTGKLYNLDGGMTKWSGTTES